jgi:hypothetical protein
MKKTALTIILFLSLLFLVATGTRFAYLGRADPYVYVGDVPPKPDTIPPFVLISSPKNNTAYNVDNVALAFNISPPTGPTVDNPIIMEVYYEDDWQQGQISVYKYTSDSYSGHPTNGEYAQYSYSLAFQSLPLGSHSITVFAEYHGWYIPGNDPHTLSMNGFSITGSSTVSFTTSYTTSSPSPSPSQPPSPTQTMSPAQTPEPVPTPTPKAESFPTTLVITSISIWSIVVIELLVYFKKSHGNRSP